MNSASCFKINRSGHMLLYNDNNEFILENELILSWPKQNPSAGGIFDYRSVYFDIGYQFNAINTDYSGEKTPWKMLIY